MFSYFGYQSAFIYIKLLNVVIVILFGYFKEPENTTLAQPVGLDGKRDWSSFTTDHYFQGIRWFGGDEVIKRVSLMP